MTYVTDSWVLQKINDFANNRAFGMNDVGFLYTTSEFFSWLFFLTHDLQFFGFWNEVKWRVNHSFDETFSKSFVDRLFDEGVSD